VPRLHHHFTVDVEEAFQVSAMEPYVSRGDWEILPSRVEANTYRLLDILAEHETLGTFFVLGWIAERHRELVRAITAAGHEVASHGYGHERVTQLDQAQFRESIRSSKSILEDITGRSVLGYRAPSFSIVRGREWALDLLVEEGYHYDSSLFPVRRPGYGFAGGDRDAHVLRREQGMLTEFPPATMRFAGMTLPAGGGAYFRLLPAPFIHAVVRAAESRGASATFYIHPWEIDENQAVLNVPWTTRLRHYGGLRTAISRLTALLRKFKFQAIASTLEQSGALSS